MRWKKFTIKLKQKNIEIVKHCFVIDIITQHHLGQEVPLALDSHCRQFGLGQWFALVKRNVIVRLQDRAQTAILLVPKRCNAPPC